MSRRSTPKSTQSSSQTSSQPKSQNLDVTTEDENASSSQASPAYLVDQCVRFMLLNMNSKMQISKSQIRQHVFHGKNPGIKFETFMTNVRTIMRNEYGLEVDVIDKTSNKKYVISSFLSQPELISEPEEASMKQVITFLVLAHIYLSNNMCKESDLWKFLKVFDLTEKTDLAGVGNIEDFVKKTLFKQHYIMYTFQEPRRGISFEPKPKLSWGPRAEATFSKIRILKFYSDLTGRDLATLGVHNDLP